MRAPPFGDFGHSRARAAGPRRTAPTGAWSRTAQPVFNFSSHMTIPCRILDTEIVCYCARKRVSAVSHGLLTRIDDAFGDVMEKDQRQLPGGAPRRIRFH